MRKTSWGIWSLSRFPPWGSGKDGRIVCDVESVKAVSEVLSPYTGIVAEVNGALMDAPQRINEAPYDSWFIRVTNITEHDEFLSAKEYEDLIAGGE